MRSDLEDKLRLCPRLPSLSGVALRLVTLARNPDVDLGEISDLLSHDPALATRILRVANSPLYSHYQRARSLGQAIRVLGLNTTVTLSLGFSLTNSLREVQTSGVDLDAFWRRALISALVAQLLGQQCKIHAREELLLAALLQDIGRLALDVALPGCYPVVDAAILSQDALVALERAQLGTDHIEVGAWLSEEWHLPDYITRAIEGSHGHDRPHGLGDLAEFVGCVTASGPIADIYLAADSAAAVATAQEVASSCLGLSAANLDAVLGRLVDSLPEIESLFQMSVLPPAQAEGLTEQARELIACRHLKSLEALSNHQSEKEHEGASDDVNEQLYDMAYRDPLTEVFNRRHFDQRLATAFAEADEGQYALSVAFLDMDDLKGINDGYGHLAGDAVIYQVAAAIGDRLRSNDLLARYGGDEFVVLLPGVRNATASVIVDRICKGVEQTVPVLESGEAITVTLSAGVATHDKESCNYVTATGLMNAADQALCEAKRQGRNRVVEAS